MFFFTLFSSRGFERFMRIWKAPWTAAQFLDGLIAAFGWEQTCTVVGLMLHTNPASTFHFKRSHSSLWKTGRVRLLPVGKLYFKTKILKIKIVVLLSWCTRHASTVAADDWEGIDTNWEKKLNRWGAPHLVHFTPMGYFAEHSPCPAIQPPLLLSAQ